MISRLRKTKNGCDENENVFVLEILKILIGQLLQLYWRVVLISILLRLLVFPLMNKYVKCRLLTYLLNKLTKSFHQIQTVKLQLVF